MRNVVCCLLVVLFGSLSSSLGQSAPRKLMYPRIVARFARFGQTGNIGPTTIYTPKELGTYRCSLVMVLTKANGISNSYWAGGILVKDGSGQHGPDFPFGNALYTDVRNTLVYEFPFRAEAGQPIQVEVKSSFGNTEGSKYNVFFVVEQLM
jgi:hypothetical protein